MNSGSADIRRIEHDDVRRVLVTGASGFIGRNLVAALESQGKEVLAIQGSASFDLVSDELPLAGVDHVFHLAARTGMVEAWQDPVSYHLVNSHGTVRVLDQCRRH